MSFLVSGPTPSFSRPELTGESESQAVTSYAARERADE